MDVGNELLYRATSIVDSYLYGRQTYIAPALYSDRLTFYVVQRLIRARIMTLFASL